MTNDLMVIICTLLVAYMVRFYLALFEDDRVTEEVGEFGWAIKTHRDQDYVVMNMDFFNENWNGKRWQKRSQPQR